MARRGEHPSFMAKDTPVSLRVWVATEAEDLILAESSWNTVDLRSAARYGIRHIGRTWTAQFQFIRQQ